MRFTQGSGEFSSQAEAPKTSPQSQPTPATANQTQTQQRESSGLLTLSLDDVIPPDHLLRQNIDPESLRELAASIQQHGQLTPILVRPRSDRKYELIAGLRRCMALDALGEHTVKAVIHSVDDTDAAHLAIVENLKRDDINPVDECEYFKYLITHFGIQPAHIASEIGKSPSYIQSRLIIGTWPEYIRTALETNLLNITQCTEIARGSNDQVQRRLYQWTIEAGANAKKITQWRKELDRQTQEHIAAGGTHQTFIPPINTQAAQPRFDCPACGVITTIENQSTLSICKTCYNALMQVINQGYLRGQAPPQEKGGTPNGTTTLGQV